MTTSVGSGNMVLSFPNASRSFDSAKNRIRFWGYDSSIEISFFIDVAALQELDPTSADNEATLLAAFDKARDKIHVAADGMYMRDRGNSYAYTLTRGDL
jgi:Protein of unknown function (DUF1488)